jgi:hypothetical protein
MKHIIKPYKGFKSFASLIVAIVFIMLCLQGCKKYFDPPYVFEEQNVNVKKKRKVLFISIDGATGSDVKEIMPPKMAALLVNSKYCWNAASDYKTTDGTNWKNIMTGVGVGKHGVVDSTLEIPANGTGHEHDTEVYYPSFIERLQESGKIKNSAGVTPWATLANRIFIYTGQPVLVSNDAEVKDSTLNKIRDQRNDLILANFNSVNIAGKKYGFSADIAEYKAAVLTVDGYIGELVDALKKRKTYNDEEWLVVITSTHGGTGKSYGDGSSRDRVVFTIYYNPSFKSLEITSPEGTDGIKFSATSILAKVPAATATDYNLNATGEYTIEFKLRIHSFGTLNGGIFSKTSNPSNGPVGWWFIHNGSNGTWRFAVRGGSTTKTLNSESLAAVPKMTIDKWYTLTARIYNEAGKRFAVLYQDGIKASAPMDITGLNIANSDDMVAGHNTTFGNITNQTITNIKFWNTALPESKILSNVCSPLETPADPYYTKLIGYWPANDGLEDFENKSPLGVGKDFKLFGAYSWTFLPPYICDYVAPPVTGVRKAMNNNDIAPQLYYWFGTTISDKWKVDGKVFLSDYEAEFIK